MTTLKYKDLTVEIIDKTWTLNPAEELTNYDLVYSDDDSLDYTYHSKIAVFLKNEDEIFRSAILFGTGLSGLDINSAVIDSDNLLVCVGSQVFCLTLPELKCEWIINPDGFSCLAIYKTKLGFVVHGEDAISMLDLSGKIKWMFSGADIFVTPEGDKAIILTEDCIELIDWNGQKYKIDYNGKEISVAGCPLLLNIFFCYFSDSFNTHPMTAGQRIN